MKLKNGGDTLSRITDAEKTATADLKNCFSKLFMCLSINVHNNILTLQRNWEDFLTIPVAFRKNKAVVL